MEAAVVGPSAAVYGPAGLHAKTVRAVAEASAAGVAGAVVLSSGPVQLGKHKR